MIKINVELLSKNGNLIESGSVIKSLTTLLNNQVSFNMRMFKSKSELEQGKGNIFCLQIPKMGIVIDFLAKDFVKITPVICEKKLQEEIEKIIIAYYQNQLDSINSQKDNLDKLYEVRKKLPVGAMGRMTEADYNKAIVDFNSAYSTNITGLTNKITQLNSIQITEII